MKKKIYIAVLILLSLCLEGCYFMGEHGSICIMQTEHGRIKVEPMKNDYREYLITATPEEGYKITKENIFIVYSDRSDSYFSYNKDNVIHPTALEDDNKFSFSKNTGSNVVINAKFEKINK